ncbi:MAG: hypothetical protein AAF614_19310 [Chloroflexota bacterium]
MKQKTFMMLLLLLLLAVTTLAGAQTGSGFDLSWTSLDAGGGRSNGGNFALGGTIGQADAEVLAAGDFSLSGGFWQCWTATAVSFPMIATSNGNIQLSWASSVPTANVYRAANDPYFIPNSAYATGVSSSWNDIGVAGDPANNYTYVIRALNGCGESADSQRLGEFDFTIVPGS